MPNSTIRVEPQSSDGGKVVYLNSRRDDNQKARNISLARATFVDAKFLQIFGQHAPDTSIFRLPQTDTAEKPVIVESNIEEGSNSSEVEMDPRIQDKIDLAESRLARHLDQNQSNTEKLVAANRSETRELILANKADTDRQIAANKAEMEKQAVRMEGQIATTKSDLKAWLLGTLAAGLSSAVVVLIRAVLPD